MEGPYGYNTSLHTFKNWSTSEDLNFTMKLVLVFGLCLVAVALARPSDIIDFELDIMEHEQEGEPGREVEGEYSWKAPNGVEYVVKYKADEDGFRVVDSNVAVETHDVDDDDDEYPKFRAIEIEDESLED